jgi:hypothetical protein
VVRPSRVIGALAALLGLLGPAAPGSGPGLVEAEKPAAPTVQLSSVAPQRVPPASLLLPTDLAPRYRFTDPWPADRPLCVHGAGQMLPRERLHLLRQDACGPGVPYRGPRRFTALNPLPGG